MNGHQFLLLIFVLLQAGDIYTTLKALKMGKREANPLLAWLFARFDPLAVMVPMKLGVVWLVWYADIYYVTAALCAMYLWVMNSNMDVIEGKK